MNLSTTHNPGRSTSPRVLRIDALGGVDAAGFACSPCSALVDLSTDLGTLLTIGSPAEVSVHEAASSPELVSVRRERSVLIPALVNAHTHLDLTLIGPQPHDPAKGFVEWVEMVRRSRPQDDAEITRAVQRGVDLSRAGGVVAVGDIAGAPGGRLNPAAWRALRATPMLGISFLEFFAIGLSEPRARAMLDLAMPELVEESRRFAAAGAGVAVSLQPHAPNTVAIPMYAHAAELAKGLAGEGTRGAILSTHLAETIEERQFVATGSGPQREMLERFGLWSDAVLNHVGQGRHSVEHLAGVLAGSRYVVAHVNDATDHAIEVLARTGSVVAYCPRASAYFAAEGQFGPHRYRDMLHAGIPVALGTDSIINLPTGSDRISTLDEMRFLHARDQLDAITALTMGTRHGARALGLSEAEFTFRVGPSAGIVAIEVDSVPGRPAARELMQSVLRSRGWPELLFGGKKFGETGICDGLRITRA